MKEYKWDGEFKEKQDDWQLTDSQRNRIITLLKTYPKMTETRRKQIASGLCGADFDYIDFVTIFGNGHYSEWVVGNYTIGTVIWYLQKYYGDDCLVDKRKTRDGGEYPTTDQNKYF